MHTKTQRYATAYILERLKSKSKQQQQQNLIIPIAGMDVEQQDLSLWWKLNIEQPH